MNSHIEIKVAEFTISQCSHFWVVSTKRQRDASKLRSSSTHSSSQALKRKMRRVWIS